MTPHEGAGGGTPRPRMMRSSASTAPPCRDSPARLVVESRLKNVNQKMRASLAPSARAAARIIFADFQDLTRLVRVSTQQMSKR